MPKHLVNQSRRRACSENVNYSCLNEQFSEPIAESTTDSCVKNEGEDESYRLILKDSFEIKQCDDLRLKYGLIYDDFEYGKIKSWSSKDYSIKVDHDKFAYSGRSLESCCLIPFKSKSLPFDREFGYIVTNNLFQEVDYGKWKLKFKDISNLLFHSKEVLVINEDTGACFPFLNVCKIGALETPPRSVAIKMTYTPKLTADIIHKGVNVKKIKMLENVFVYFVMRVPHLKNEFQYIQLYAFQWNSWMSSNRNPVNGVINDKNNCTIISCERKFPFKVLSYPSRERGKFLVWESNETRQLLIENYPEDMMEISPDEFHMKLANAI